MFIPKYKNVSDKIYQEIISNTSYTESVIPTEEELCNQFNVSRTTVRNALELLANQNLLIRTKGKGYIINDTKEDISTTQDTLGLYEAKNKDGKIIKSTLVKAMKDNASFSPVTDIYYKLEDSHTLRKVDYENGLLKTYFIYNKDGIPDGESVEYYEEGNIESIVHFRNNIVEGLTITYYENGNIDEEVNYKNNKMNGEAKSYDENGKLNGRTIFKDDIKLEEDVYKENEILKNTFKNGELVKQDICSPNGTLKERRILNGDEIEYSTFYPNGNVKQKILAKDKIIIKEQIYARNGNIMSNSFFSDGKPVIELFEYYPDGKLFRKISTINKMLNGDSIEYYPSGNIKEKVFFDDNKMNGEAIKYYENGVVKEKAYFINDKQEKEHFFYDEKGKLIKTDIYKNGIKQ